MHTPFVITGINLASGKKIQRWHNVLEILLQIPDRDIENLEEEMWSSPNGLSTRKKSFARCRKKETSQSDTKQTVENEKIRYMTNSFIFKYTKL